MKAADIPNDLLRDAYRKVVSETGFYRDKLCNRPELLEKIRTDLGKGYQSIELSDIGDEIHKRTKQPDKHGGGWSLTKTKNRDSSHQNVLFEKASHSSRTEMVIAKSIQLSRIYQREFFKEAKVKKIVNNFYPEAFGTLTVGRRRDKSLWIVDGWHRWAAALEMGWKRVPCYVFDSEGSPHEARIFGILNRERTNINPIDVYRASLEAGDSTTKSIQDVLDSYGVRVTRSSGPNGIAATSALYSIYSRGLLETVMSLCHEFRNSEHSMKSKRFSNTMLHMLAQVCREVKGIDDKRLRHKLREMTYQEFRTIEHSSGGTSGGRGSRMAWYFIEHHYNHRLQGKARISVVKIDGRYISGKDYTGETNGSHHIS